MVSHVTYSRLSKLMIFLIMEVHHDQLSLFILIQNKVLHPRHANEMTAGRFPPLGGSFLTTWSFGRAAL